MPKSATLRQEIMKYYTIRRFDGGLNNAFADHMLLDHQASAIMNFDLTTRGSIKVRNGFARLNTSALTDISGCLSALSASYYPSGYYLSGGIAHVSGTAIFQMSAVVSAVSATYAPSAFHCTGTAYLSAAAIWPSAGATLYVIDASTRGLYLRVPAAAAGASPSAAVASKPIRGLTRFYNTSGSNQWVACCSGRVHFGTSKLSSYLTQTFTVDADMQFEVFKDTLLMFNGVDKYKSKLRSKSDSSAWTNCPATSIVRPWQDRLWCVPTGSAYIVRHTSAVGSDDAWVASDYFAVGRQDGGDIIALEVFQGNLIILKTTGIYVLVGTAPENYQLERMSKHGCIARRSVVVGDTGIIYLSPDGVRLFDGMNSTLLSETEQYKVDILGAMNMNAVNDVAAVYFDRKYILGYDDSGASTVRNNYTFVYNFLTGTWTKYDIGANAFFKTLGSNEDLDLYFGSSLSGFVYKMFTGTTDDGVGQTSATNAISARYLTKGFDFSSQYQDLGAAQKQIRNVLVQGNLPSGTIDAVVRVDDGATYTKTFQVRAQAELTSLWDVMIWDVDNWGSNIKRFSRQESLGVRAQGHKVSLELKANQKGQSGEINLVTFGYRKKRVGG
jgi:hypothetical protein